MRKRMLQVALFSSLGITGALAAPVPGYEAQYAAVVASCTIPAGNATDCEAAINAYSGVLVGAVDLATANESFTQLRSEVFGANAPNEPFQTQIDALFELLLPDSGAVAGPGAGAPAAGPAPAAAGGGGSLTTPDLGETPASAT